MRHSPSGKNYARTAVQTVRYRTQDIFTYAGHVMVSKSHPAAGVSLDSVLYGLDGTVARPMCWTLMRPSRRNGLGKDGSVPLGGSTEFGFATRCKTRHSISVWTRMRLGSGKTARSESPRNASQQRTVRNARPRAAVEVPKRGRYGLARAHADCCGRRLRTQAWSRTRRRAPATRNCEGRCRSRHAPRGCLAAPVRPPGVARACAGRTCPGARGRRRGGSTPSSLRQTGVSSLSSPCRWELSSQISGGPKFPGAGHFPKIVKVPQHAAAGGVALGILGIRRRADLGVGNTTRTHHPSKISAGAPIPRFAAGLRIAMIYFFSIASWFVLLRLHLFDWVRHSRAAILEVYHA